MVKRSDLLSSSDSSASSSFFSSAAAAGASPAASVAAAGAAAANASGLARHSLACVQVKNRVSVSYTSTTRGRMKVRVAVDHLASVLGLSADPNFQCINHHPYSRDPQP